MKAHELGIVLDKPIRLLCPQADDIDPEAIISSRPFMASLHDSRARAGNHPSIPLEPAGLQAV